MRKLIQTASSLLFIITVYYSFLISCFSVPPIKEAVCLTPTESFTPTSPFHLNYGLYNVKEEGSSIINYIKGIQTIYDGATNSIRICAPYMVYHSNVERFVDETDYNNYTDVTTVVNTLDTWQVSYNLQPYVDMNSRFVVKGYSGNTLVRSITFTVTPNSASLATRIFLQDTVINLTGSLDGVDNIRVSLKNVSYSSQMYPLKTTTKTITVDDHEETITQSRWDKCLTSKRSTETAFNEYVTFFGDYFLSTVTCSGNGTKQDETNIKAIWNTVESYYNDLPDGCKLAISNASLNNDYPLAKALTRYDYILFYKHYDVTDFLNRSNSPNRVYQVSKTNIYNIQEYNDLDVLIIIISSSIAILSITTLSILLIRKKKINSS